MELDHERLDVYEGAAAGCPATRHRLIPRLCSHGKHVDVENTA